MTMSYRGVHPDLIDEQETPQEAPQPAPAPRGRGGRARAPEPAAPSPEPTSEAADQPAAESEQEPEWVAQWRDTKDPAEAFKLLAKNLPKDVLEHEPTIYGWVGAQSEKRAKELLRE